MESNDSEDSEWEYTEIIASCLPETLLKQWTKLTVKFSKLYLHNDDGIIYKPDFFEKVFVNPGLRKLIVL